MKIIITLALLAASLGGSAQCIPSCPLPQCKPNDPTCIKQSGWLHAPQCPDFAAGCEELAVTLTTETIE
jgi:hypothetical protein